MTDVKNKPPRYVHPGFLMAHLVNPVINLVGGPALVVKGRRTGRPITTPLAPFDYKGARYLVSGGGETHWVRNLRAAGEGEIRKGRAQDPFRAVEVTGEERNQVVAAYRDAMGRRAQAYFAALPDLADHPAFRLERR